MTAITTTGIVIPMAAFAPLDRPLDPELGAGEEPPLEAAVGELPVFVDVGRVEVVVWAGAVKAAESLLCHQIGIPSPQIVYAEFVIVVVAGVPSTTALFDRLVET
jgi:hypothetical protein